MNLQETKAKLEKYNQSQLLKYYDELDENQRQSLLKQIDEIDFDLLKLIEDGGKETEKGVITPLDDAVSIADIEANKDKYTAIGTEAIKEGKVAALLLAGGMGTRLGSDKPKGMYNIGLTRDVYIFEMLIKNLMDVVNQTGAWVPLYIMTSEKNNDDTVKFFEEMNYFGYDKNYVDFFVQEMAPAASFDGKIFLEDKDRISTSPNGNGGWFISFVKACGRGRHRYQHAKIKDTACGTESQGKQRAYYQRTPTAFPGKPFRITLKSELRQVQPITEKHEKCVCGNRKRQFTSGTGNHQTLHRLVVLDNLNIFGNFYLFLFLSTNTKILWLILFPDTNDSKKCQYNRDCYTNWCEYAVKICAGVVSNICTQNWSNELHDTHTNQRTNGVKDCK